MMRRQHPLEDLTALVDGALAPERTAEVEEHVARCATCREEVTRLRGAIAVLAALPPAPDLPPFLGARLEARLREERARPAGVRRWLAALPRLRLLAAAGALAGAALAGGIALHQWLDTRRMVEDLDLLQDYETASAVGVDTPEDALIVAQLDQLEREGKP